MSSTLTRIDKELYIQLQEFAFKKHKNFRSAKIEIDKAIEEYLSKQTKEEKR